MRIRVVTFKNAKSLFFLSLFFSFLFFSFFFFSFFLFSPFLAFFPLLFIFPWGIKRTRIWKMYDTRKEVYINIRSI